MEMIAPKRQLAGNSRIALANKPLAGGLGAGLVASLCCGGSLLFAWIGLGALYGSLGLFRYLPRFLAAGTLAIVGINLLFYRRKALVGGLACDGGALRQSMYMSAGLGLALMVGSRLLLEWFNHAVVNAARFMARPECATALMPGVPNQHLLYALFSFAGLGLLRVLPFPNQSRAVPA